MSRPLNALTAAIAVGAVVLMASPTQAAPVQAAPAQAASVASAEAAAPVKGQTRVKGYTKAECETKGGRVARKKQNEGYTVTFVGCSYDGFNDPPWTGIVFWHK